MAKEVRRVPQSAPVGLRQAGFAVIAATTLPWLFPFAGGPSAAAEPLLFAWFCCGVLALFMPTKGKLATLVLAVAILLAVATWGVGADWFERSWLPPVGAALAGLICAAIGMQRRFHRPLALALLVGALVSGAIGLCQYFGIAAAFHPWMNVAPAGEAFGNLRQRNQLASLLNIGLVALLWWMAARGSGASQGAESAAGGNPARPAARTARPDAARPTARPNPLDAQPDAWVMPAAVLLAVGNAATASRTGFVQLLLVVALAWWWARKRGIGERRDGALGVLAAAALAYAIAAFALPWLAGLDPNQHGLFARLAQGAQPCASRLVLWSNVLDLIGLEPWAGWGLGNLDYAHYIHLNDGARFCDILDNAHNLPLHLAVELGVPVAVLGCGALLMLIVRARPWRESDPARQFAWSILALVGLHSLLEYPLWYGPFQMATGFALGMLLQRPETAKAPVFETNRPKALVQQSALAIVIVAMCGFAARDYWRVTQIYRPSEARPAALQGDAIAKLSGSPLFADQVRFARLTTTALTPQNAQAVNELARNLLHFSPEPRVIEPLIESARLLGHEEEARFHEVRYRAAFPRQFAAWSARAAQSAR